MLRSHHTSQHERRLHSQLLSPPALARLTADLLLFAPLAVRVAASHSERWLKKHGITDYEVLLMRKAADFRPGAVVKAEIFRKEIEGKYDVLYAIDDNPKILKMWAQLGIRCMYCGLPEHLESGHDVTP